MAKKEIFWNGKISNYTLKEIIDEVKSIKKIPLKFKLEDSTSKFRKEILKESLLENIDEN